MPDNHPAIDPTAATTAAGGAAGFGDAGLLDRLNTGDAAWLDALDFGVIAIDADGTVQRYNAFESRLAGLSPDRVLGKALFTAVAPCMNNALVAQRIHAAQAGGHDLDVQVDYVLTLRMRPVKVTLRLLASPASALRYVLVRRPA